MPEAVVATSPALLLHWVERDTNATLVEVNGGGHHPVTAAVVVNPQLKPSTVNIRADRKNGDPGPVGYRTKRVYGRGLLPSDRAANPG